MPFSYRSYKKKASSMSACIIARHRAIGRPGVDGVCVCRNISPLPYEDFENPLLL